MSVLKTKCLSTKLTADEWATVARAAAGQPLSAWARTTLLDAAAAPPADQILLAEILALRALVLHIQVAVHNGDPVTLEHLHRLMARVDADKIQHARERLAPAPGTIPGRIR